ncbi:MAG: hypothetical protein ACP5L3_07635 [Caldisericum sp.]|uniref:hypothetical protein n=1 Tax=Caldisericum sp. TaxID=2499687 RepID=UPI003D11BB2A
MKTLNQKIFSFIFVFLLITSIFMGLNFGTDNVKADGLTPYNYVLVLNVTQPGLQYLFNLTSANFNFSNLPYYYFKDGNGNYVYAWIESLGCNNGIYYANVWINLTNSTSYYLIYYGNYNQYMGINPVLDFPHYIVLLKPNNLPPDVLPVYNFPHYIVLLKHIYL